MAARRRRRPSGEEHGGGGGHGGASGRWLVSYADFITLMFVVFTVLFSMAKVDAANYGRLAKSLRASLGPSVAPLPTRDQPGQVVPVVPLDSPANGKAPGAPDWTQHVVQQPPAGDPSVNPPTDAAKITPKDPPAVSNPDKPPVTAPADSSQPAAPSDPMSDLSRAFEALPGARTGALAVALQERGLVVTIAGSVLFDPGKTSLKPDAEQYLDQVSGKLRGVELPVMVEGTADQTQVAGAPDPWDLAALRAGSVVRYMVERRGLPSAQFVTIGYGSSIVTKLDGQVTIVVMRKK